MTYTISFFVLIIIAFGIYYKKKRAVHYSLMGSAFVIDVALVLYLEFTRGAIDKAMNPSGPLLIFHIAVSVVAMLLYLVQFYLGYRFIKGRSGSIKMHRYCGITFVLCRVTNFVTSFMVVTPA